MYYNHKSGGGRSQMLGDYTDSATTPLFPFGHGLSYTRFAYANLDVSPRTADADHAAAHRRRGHQHRRARRRRSRAALRPRPRRQRHAAGEAARRLRARAPAARARRAAFASRSTRASSPSSTPRMRFVVEPGAFRIMIGASSDDIRAEATVTLVGVGARAEHRRAGANRSRDRLTGSGGSPPSRSGAQHPPPSPLCPAVSTVRLKTDTGDVLATLDCGHWSATGAGYAYRRRDRQ